MGLLDQILVRLGFGDEVQALRGLVEERPHRFLPALNSTRFDLATDAVGLGYAQRKDKQTGGGSYYTVEPYWGNGKVLSVTPPGRGVARFVGRNGQRTKKLAGLLDAISRQERADVLTGLPNEIRQVHGAVQLAYSNYMDGVRGFFSEGGILIASGPGVPRLNKMLEFEEPTFLGWEGAVNSSVFYGRPFYLPQGGKDIIYLEVGVRLEDYEKAHLIDLAKGIQPVHQLHQAELEFGTTFNQAGDVERRIANALKQVPRNLRGPEARRLFIKGFTGSLGLLLALGLFVHSSSAQASENTDVDSSTPESFLENSWFRFGVGLFFPKLDMALSCMEMIS